MENKMLALKVYDVDYSFIIKNYLDPKLWEKEWTIFIYKRFEITLRLQSIDVGDKRIWFEVVIKDNNEDNKNPYKNIAGVFSYFLSIENIQILKNTLSHTIFCTIQRLERDSYIEYTEKYEEIQGLRIEEQEKLEKIAEEILDSEGITNEEIREPYIDSFILKNEKVSSLSSKYRDVMKYQILTDFYIAFLKATNDKDRLEIIRQKTDSGELKEILEQIEKHKEYIKTEEFEEDMKNSLKEV